MNLIPFPAHDGTVPRAGAIPPTDHKTFAQKLEERLAAEFPGECFRAYADCEGDNILLAAPRLSSQLTPDSMERKIRTIISRMIDAKEPTAH